MYKANDIVYAKCTSYPYWPGKILSVQTKNGSYRVLFYGEKSEAILKEDCIMPFNDQNTKLVLAEGNNSQNYKLKKSIQVAMNRFRSRKKGNLESSDGEEYHDSEKFRRQDRRTIQKPKHMIVYKIPEEPHQQLTHLLALFSSQISAFTPNEPVQRFTPECQQRLKELLQPGSGLLLATLIELRVIERMILLLKEMELWGMGRWKQLGGLVRQRYEEYKTFILSEQLTTIPLKEMMRDVIVQKVSKNKAILN